MKLLLDTQAFIWFVENEKNLPKKIKEIIENSQNLMIVSIASLWEMTIKVSLGKLKLSSNIEGMINKITENGFEIVQISPKHLIQLSKLELIHGDPFDRIIISQGLSENIKILTSDDKFDEYNIDRLWK